MEQSVQFVKQKLMYVLLHLPYLVLQVKKVMNSVYQSAAKKFDRERKYKGTRVLEKLLGIIKVGSDSD